MERYLFLLTILLSSSLFATPAPPPPSPHREDGPPQAQLRPATRVVHDVASLLSGLVIPQARDSLQDLSTQLPSENLASLLTGHARVREVPDERELEQEESRETKRPRQNPHWDLNLDDEEEQPAPNRIHDLEMENADERGIDAIINELIISDAAVQELDAALDSKFDLEINLLDPFARIFARIAEENARIAEARAHNSRNPDLISRLPGDPRRHILRYLTPMDRNSMRSACTSFKQHVDDARSKCKLTDTLHIMTYTNSPDMVILSASYPHIYCALPDANWDSFSIWRVNIEANQARSFLKTIKDIYLKDANLYGIRAVVASDSLYFGDCTHFMRLNLTTGQVSALSSRPPMVAAPQITLLGDIVVYISGQATLFNTRTQELRELDDDGRDFESAFAVDGKAALLKGDLLLVFKGGLKDPPHEVKLPESALDAIICGENIALLTKKGVVLVSKDGVKLSSFARVKCPTSGYLVPGLADRCVFAGSKHLKGTFRETCIDAVIEWHATRPSVRSYEREGPWNPRRRGELLLSGRYLVHAHSGELELKDMETGKRIRLFRGLRPRFPFFHAGPFLVGVCSMNGLPNSVTFKIDLRGYCSEES